MATPQHGIFALGTRAHHHLLLDLEPGADQHALLRALSALREAANTVAGVNIVVGLGSELCRSILPDALPDGVGPYEDVTGCGYTLPADQHDLWVWLHAAAPDGIFDVARATARALDGLARVVVEQPSFTYQASQDLTGFEDGTENPPLDEAHDVVVVPDGEPGAGSSVALVQKWVHDLDGFDHLSGLERDQVIGRDYLTGEELDDEHQSPHAHISRVVLEDEEGNELEIFRRSSAYGGVLEHGLMFIAFAADVNRMAAMMRAMVGADDGIHDRLLEFSRSVGGGWYVVPPIEAFRLD